MSNKGDGVKKVSAWDWFDFPQLTENASLVEFYKDVKLSEKRNKDNPSLDKYKPTLKTTLSVLDRQYLTDSPENKKYAYIKSECFSGIIEKPIVFEALGRLLINYQSEWYSEVGADGKMPEWEALNSEMTDDAENALGYLKDGDEAKRDAYLKNIGKTADSEEAAGLKQRRERISRFPEDYKENPKGKLNQEQFEDYTHMHGLEVDVEMWEKEKEKIKKCLWWKDVVNGLANQNQPTAEANTGNGNGGDTQTAQTDTPPPATLNQDGKAWYIHPISIINYFSAKTYLFEKGDKHEIIREINIRLAGFGGNVPTDEFTERTEKMIKQFQRDYMKVEETGIVDMKVIEAIDKFQEEYAISDTVWSQIKCRCGNAKCNGFGSGEGQNTSPERYNTYEYPGIHRSLLFGFCALNFYLNRQDVYRFRLISSGYRCSRHSEGKKTTNHRGKALDIQFYKNSWAIGGLNKNNIEPLLYIRDNFFKTYLKAQDEWKDANLFTTEPIGLDANDHSISGYTYSWIHVDVRSFEKQYLLDEYFCTDATTLNKEKLIILINK